MKKSLLVLMAFMPLLFFSCGQKENPTPAPTPVPEEPEVFNVTTKEFNVGKAEGTVEVPVSHNYSYTASVSSDAQTWLSVVETKAVVEGKVTIGYRANTLAQSRTGKVTLKSSKSNTAIEVTITQAAGDPKIEPLAVTKSKVDPKGMTYSVSVDSNDELIVTYDADWVTLTETKAVKEYNFTVAKNDTGADRQAIIKFTSKADSKVSISDTLVQKPANMDPKAISILAIGNSFSQDAMEYLNPMLKELGYETIRLTNLFVSGCSLKTHAENFKEDKAAYTVYSLNDDGNMVAAAELGKASSSLEPDNWDFITVQQASGESGIASSYGQDLDDVVAYIKGFCPYTPLVWHMTWAYAQNSTHADFPKYGSDQMEMYESIVDAVSGKISTNKEFSAVIPSGTAIQNLRTSFFEDNLTRDGYHLSYNIGRVVAAATWAKTLTGKSIDEITFIPKNAEKKDYIFEPDYYPAIKEAVNNASATPMKVTATRSYAPSKSVVPNEDLRKILSGAGYDPSQYEEISYTVMHRGYYNSGASQSSTCAAASPSNFVCAYAGSIATNLSTFAGTKIFEKSQLPVGTLLVVKEGYQYRPEGWTALNATNATRPDNVKTAIVEIDDEWWGSFNFRAFNLTFVSGGTPEKQPELESCFGIFIPKTAVGFGAEDYDQGSWNW